MNLEQLKAYYNDNKDKDLLAVTHDGSFHADDVVAASLLKMMFTFVTFKRSRKESDFKKADIVFDVGGGVFDHHGLDKEYRDCGTPYASAGLVWRAFGRSFIRDHVLDVYDMTLDDDGIEFIFDALEDGLIKSVDALDNGIVANTALIGDVMDVSKIVSLYNVPTFEGSVLNKIYGTMHASDHAFSYVCEIIRGLIIRVLDRAVHTLSDREAVKDLYESAVARGDRFIEFPRVLDWSNTLIQLDEKGLIEYVVYPATNQWNVQTVPVAVGSFESRKDFPKAWAGLTDARMAEVSGVDDATFCHSNLFLAVAKSREGALRLLDSALRR